MTKLIMIKSRRILALLLAAILAIGMVQMTAIINAYAAPQASFTVSIDSGIEGSIKVTLTNQSTPEETLTVPVIAGIAEFLNFYDEENSYLLEITGMIGYADFSATVNGENTGISYLPSDFTPVDYYAVAISAVGSGSITVDGSPAKPAQDVNHGDSLVLTLTPALGYDVNEVLLDGTAVDNYDYIDASNAYTFELSSITEEHTIAVTFSAIQSLTGDELDYYNLNAQELISGYPIVSGGKNVYSFINDDALATITPKTPYTKIRINDSAIGASMQFSSSALIEKLEVYNPNQAGDRWRRVPIAPQGIQILMDKTAPVVADIPPMNWTNQDYTVSGTVTDENTSAAPSSGITGVVWSKTALTNAQALAETVNRASVTDNAYSFTISEEQNNEIFYVYAIDQAQNVSAAKTINIKIDKTNPEIIGFEIEAVEPPAFSRILNFLTFGNFVNTKTKITITVDDQNGATSGISKITLYTDGMPLDLVPRAVGDGTYFVELALPDTVFPGLKILDAELSAVATDNAANITGKDEDNPAGVPVTPSAINSDLKSDRLMIETIKPVIDISYPIATYVDDESRQWYPDDVAFTVTTQDTNSGIRSVQIKVNNTDITTDADGKAVNANFYSTETHQEVFRIDTSQGTRASDGSYLIEVTVIDNAGNEYSANDIVYKDNGNPVITGYHFTPTTSDGISETSDYIDFMEYGFYFKTEFSATIQISDPEGLANLDRANYRFVSYRNGAVVGETSGTQNIVGGTVVLLVPEGFMGQIYLEAFDRIGNSSGEITPRAFLIDDVNPQISVVNNNTTSYFDAEGNKLYTSDTSFTVVVSDAGSGIKEIGYSKSAEKEPFERKSLLIRNSGNSVGDILEDGWVVSEMDYNLVTKVTKTFVFNADDNNISLTFDATDRSGNKLENIRSERITIDKTAPIINVTFRADEDNNEYYNQNRIADITVIDRNLDEKDITVNIENKYGSVPSFAFSRTSQTVYAAVIEFDEGDYTFDVTGKDLGEQAATVNYSGGNEKLFYVDKTNPVVQENFSEFSNDIENSFRTDKIVTIKIKERNFDPELVNLRVTRKDAGGAHTTSGLEESHEGGGRWEDVGDVHTLSFTLSHDAVYQVEITPTDLAGNAADHRSTVVFEIDKTAPVVIAKNGEYVSEDNVEFLDVYSYSRKDAPIPTVEFEDVNLAYIKYDLTVYIPDYSKTDAQVAVNPVKVYVDEDKDKTGKISGSKFTLPQFAKDGVYALELTAVDIAGNESILNKNTYAKMIEQDVLAYILESNLEKKTGIYSFQYENGDAISKKPDNFNDIKILVLAKKDSDIDIVLRDNNATELNTNAQMTMDDGIYGIGIYNFVVSANFFKENFQDDTDVELHLTVNNEGNRIDLGKMHIDNIAPTCELPKEFVSWHWYYGEEDRTITISNISELIDENKCRVYDNGKEIEFVYSSADNTLAFTLGKGWHNIGIVLDDIAGNTNNIQERTNIHIGYFWLWIILVSSAFLIAAAAFILIRIMKKRRLEGEETIKVPTAEL